jgi:inner membrane transporter RhtA
MARLSRATFSLLLVLLPASAVVIGVIVLQQIPTLTEVLGILFIAVGIALHREREPAQIVSSGAPGSKAGDR